MSRVDSLGDLTDALIVAFAAAHDAHIDVDLVEQPVDSRIAVGTIFDSRRVVGTPSEVAKWEAVAHATNTALRGFITASRGLGTATPRIALGIETDPFTGPVAQQRARFVAWSSARKAEEVANLAHREATSDREERRRCRRLADGVSTFNVVRGDTIANNIARIFADVRNKLPSAVANATSDLSESDDDVGRPVEVFQPLAYETLSPSEQEEQDARLKAEDDLMVAVQCLQQAHYEKWRRWVEVPVEQLTLTATPAVETKLTAESMTTEISDMSPVEIAVLLDRLGIGEYKDAFRRTTGQLLSSMSRNEVNSRFGSDREASDLLWHHLKGLRPEPKTPAPPATTVEVSARDLFESLRQPITRPNGGLREQLQTGDLSSLKRAMLGASGAGLAGRPLRPSQLQEELMDETDADPYKAASIAEESQAVTATASAADHHDPNLKPISVTKQTVPPSRANRWQIVEYGDEEDGDAA